LAEEGIAYFENDDGTLRKLLPELEAHFQDVGMNAIEIAGLHFHLNENDKGFEWLERSYSRQEPFLPEITYNPDLDGVRNDPRYFDLLKRLGLEQTAQPK